MDGIPAGENAKAFTSGGWRRAIAAPSLKLAYDVRKTPSNANRSAKTALTTTKPALPGRWRQVVEHSLKRTMPSEMKADLQSVRDQLEAMRRTDPAKAPYKDDEGEPLWDPIEVFPAISCDNFREWLANHEGELRHWCYEPIADGCGRVVVYHLPSDVQEATASDVVNRIYEQLVALGGTSMMRTLEAKASPTCRVGESGKQLQEPDGSLTPRETRLTTKFPNLVVEIEFENRSFAMLEQKLHAWMGRETTVQVAIGIKIFKESRNHRAIILVRGDEPRTIYFGSKETNSKEPNANVPLLQFPIKALYHGATIPRAIREFESGMISIDLATLRVDIDERLDHNAVQKRREDRDRSATPTMKKQRRFHMKAVNKEIDDIERADLKKCVVLDNGGEPLLGNVVVCDSISRADFRARTTVGCDAGGLSHWENKTQAAS